MIDLGVRLDEALAMGLASEPVTYTSKVDPRESLCRCGASEEECAFLVHARDAPNSGSEAEDGWSEDEDAWGGDETRPAASPLARRAH